MSLSDEERKIMVEFEIEKAHRIIDQFPILKMRNFGIHWLTGFIMPFSMLLQHC